MDEFGVFGGCDGNVLKLIVVMIEWTIKHQLVHLKWVNWVLCELYCKKAVLLKEMKSKGATRTKHAVGHMCTMLPMMCIFGQARVLNIPRRVTLWLFLIHKSDVLRLPESKTGQGRLYFHINMLRGLSGKVTSSTQFPCAFCRRIFRETLKRCTVLRPLTAMLLSQLRFCWTSSMMAVFPNCRDVVLSVLLSLHIAASVKDAYSRKARWTVASDTVISESRMGLGTCL